MTRRLAGRMIAVGATLLLAAAALLAWQAWRQARTVQVWGRVVDLDCRQEDGCRPIVEYVAPDGDVRRMLGPGLRRASTYEVGDEWLSVLHDPAYPGSGRTADDGSALLLGAVVLVLGVLGAWLLGPGWARRVRLPPRREPRRAWLPRAAVTIVAALACWPVLSVLSLGGLYLLALGVVLPAAAVPTIRMLGRRRYPRHAWGAVAVYPAALAVIVSSLALLLLPARLAPGVLFFVPLTAALTLPLQARLWPSLEVWLSERHARAATRARIRRALDSDDPNDGMIVRVVESVLDDRSVRLRWRNRSGEEWLEASWDAFPRTPIHEGEWYLLEEPVLEHRAMPGAGYRGVELSLWVSKGGEPTPLGADLEVAQHGSRDDNPRRWLYAIPPLACVGAALLGGWALDTQPPPATGEPIPDDGLVAQLSEPVFLRGTVTELRSWPGIEEGDGCDLRVEPSSPPSSCRVHLLCAAPPVHVYPQRPNRSRGFARCLTSARGALVAEDTTASDGDPALRLDTRVQQVIVTTGEGGEERRLQVTLQP